MEFNILLLSDESTTSMHILGFETANWRQAREQALATADQRPLASTGRKVKHIDK